LLDVVLPAAALVCVCAVNYWVFPRLFDSNYLRWYVSAGPFIGLATAAFGAAWGKLDNNTGLISAVPLHYIGACLQVVGLPVLVFGGHVRSKNQPRGVGVWNVLFTLPLLVALVVAAVGWLLLIAPLQYFVFLICGAPSRIAMTSAYRVQARMHGWGLAFDERNVKDPKPEEGWDASMTDKPVTLANAFSAAALFLLGRLLS
jgi:hypothetical protein